MGNAKDLMWNRSGKHAMSAWKAAKADREMRGEGAMEDGTRAERQRAVSRVKQCRYCGNSWYEGTKCSGCGATIF